MINIEEQIQELLQFQPGLQIKYSDDNQIALTGIIKINAEYNKIQLVDKFLVEILVFKNFPDKIPVIYELGKRINKKLFHVLFSFACFFCVFFQVFYEKFSFL